MDTNWNNIEPGTEKEGRADMPQLPQSTEAAAELSAKEAADNAAESAAGQPADAQSKPEKGRKTDKVTDVSRKSRASLRRMLCRWLAWVLLGLCVALITSDFEMMRALAEDPQGILMGEVTAVPKFRRDMMGLGVQALRAAASMQESTQYSAEDRLALLAALETTYRHGDVLGWLSLPEGQDPAEWPETLMTMAAPDGLFSGLPEGYAVLFSWRTSGEPSAEWVSFLGQNMLLTEFAAGAGYRCPTEAELGSTSIILAMRRQPQGALTDYYYTAKRWQIISCGAAGALALSLLIFLYTAIRAKDVRAGKALVAGALGHVWLELKIGAALLLLAPLWDILRFGARRWIGGVPVPYLTLPLIFLGFYLLWADLSINGMALYECSGCAALGRAARGWARKQPWQRRVLGGFGAGMLAALALGGIAEVMALLILRGRGFGPQVPITGLLCLAGALAALFGAFWVLRRLVAEWGLVAGKLADVRAGRPTAPLALPEGSLLAGPAEDLNRIQDGVTLAVEQRSRADRMKVELLTNVSHDIKTPLTSILSYADLLCAEPDLPETAAGYARILQQKATQLRGMVQDVFELSKAASGSLPVELTTLDLAKLIRQTLADMDEKIASAPAQFKVQLCPEAWVLADGDRLYRVFQNLFANAAQYSMPGSRVYVTLTAADGWAEASIKNMADYELGTLGMDAQELTERFVRGDASRSSEGSGLGLSIAKSFTEACGGRLSLRTEADLFIVAVSLPLTGRPGTLPDGMQEVPLFEGQPGENEAADKQNRISDKNI